MERESFSDDEVAKILNENFISIKVDREERPDIDHVYMEICQTVTGNGGWPLTIIMTPNQEPFFAGTYLSKNSKYGKIGLIDLLQKVTKMWKEQKEMLEKNSELILDAVYQKTDAGLEFDMDIKDETYSHLRDVFDQEYGGFGNAPKFPMPHNILFLLDYYRLTDDIQALEMAEKTLQSMYFGGIFDHIGGGFSRYSTDQFWLIPHFEKMLYDNALLLSAYTRAYEITENVLYKEISEKIISYVNRDLKDQNNVFCSAEDADCMGEEGKFYAFTNDEILEVLGKDSGRIFNEMYGITKNGNFEGKSIPNLIGSKSEPVAASELLKLYEYRKARYDLHKDDKILTSWNCLYIASLAQASIVFKNEKYIEIAKTAFSAVNRHLRYKNLLFTSYREGKRTGWGFLDDYAFYIYACIRIYQATLETNYMENALTILEQVIEKFWDKNDNGFFLNTEEEKLIIRPKETYDGAIPSGNSVMYYNLVYLFSYTDDLHIGEYKNKHFKFMSNQNASLMGFNSFFAYAIVLENTVSKIVCVPKNETINIDLERLKDFDIVKISEKSRHYPLKNDKTTYYVCKGKICLPPNNDINNL